MNLSESNKPKITDTVVVYAGRFQPFHKGHYDAYQRLCSKFGSGNVYIGTSNDTSGGKSPFNFKEKKEIATKMFGVPSSKFVKVNNPYRPVEILKKFDGKTTKYIAAVGDKDADRLKGKYFKPYKDKEGYGYDEIGYVYPVPPEPNPISGTDVRNGLGNTDKEKAKKFFLKAYPKFDKDIFNMIKSKLNEDGFPGGIGTGLNLPNGYINGAPTGSTSELYDPISEIVNQVITEDAFTNFVKEYFDKIENELLMEDDDVSTPNFPYTGTDALDSPQNYVNYVNRDWQEFDNYNYVSHLPGWSIQGHLSDSYPESVTKLQVPVNNHKYENGPGKMVIHPSKGEEYVKDKSEKWEVKPHLFLDKTYNPEGPYEEFYENINTDKDVLIEGVNKELDRDITYTNTKGEPKKIRARDALRLPKDHPAHIQAAKIVGPDDAPVNEPKKKEEPGKAAQAAAKPAQPGQPVKQGQTAQGKIDNQTQSSTNPAAGEEQGPPPEQKLSGAEFKSDAEKNVEKEKSGNTNKSFVNRISSSIQNWSKEEKEFFKNKVHKGNSPERRSWSKAIIDKTKGAGHAIMRGLKHEGHIFKHAAGAVGKLMSGKKLDDSDKKAMKSVGIKIALTALFGAFGGGLAHGALGFAKHVAMELIPHAVGDVVATGVGKAALFASAVVDDATQLNIFAAAIAERMQNMEITPQMMVSMIDSYNNKKLQKKFSLNENISPSKIESINNFIEFATKRLKLKEKPEVTLLTGPEYAEQKSSLGGYNPESKNIYVVTDKRLTADILRTLAHEMVHRKQDELNLIKNDIEDGKDGSPIENQAHAVAGILMREYGRINKQIYTEDINIDVDKGDTVLMGKFKNKKVVVKDFGKDDHGMPTINGKVATTFRMGQKGQNVFDKDENINEMGSKDIHFKNIVKYYDKGSSNVKKQVGLVVSGNKYAHRNEIVGELRDMGYDEIRQIEKKLDIEDFDESIETLYKDIHEFISNYFGETIAEVSALSGEDSQSDGAYIPKGKIRKLGGNDGVNKSDDWYVNGGYTQVDFPKADAIWGDDDENQLTVSYKAKNLPRSKDNISTNFPVRKPIKKLLHEGGAYGHMSHPFDDVDLTFGDLKTIISSALEGELGVVREKTDGQALAISWKNGRLIAARNKSNLANAGADAMGIEDVASKFAGRGGLTDAYNFAMKDLSSAIGGLSDAQRKKIFNEGKCFMNLEVIWPESVNVIPYGQALLIFHNTVCYDETGKAIGADNGAASMLAGMIKQINADIQSRYVIQGPPITSIPKSEDLSAKQGKYVSKLSKLQNQFGLKDTDTVSDYHQSWWENFIDKNSPLKVDKLTKDALIRRWAFGDKSFRLNTISNLKIQKWAIDNDKVNVVKQQKENIRPFEEIFLGVGADVLEFVGSVLTVYPDKAIRSMKDRLKSVAAQVRSGGDPSKIAKLKAEFARLNSLGGVSRIVASEGLVFFYNGKTYKLTGTFAPLNQILGIFYS